ncbi:hypothetical protein ABNF65_02765 [Paenibacillus larvae]
MDLKKYPNAAKLYKSNPEAFQERLDKALSLIEKFYDEENHSLELFGIGAIEAAEVFCKAFFNPKGILKFYPEKDYAKALEELGPDLSPAAIFSDRVKLYDTSGNRIDRKDFTKEETLEGLFQSIMYAMRFLPANDLTSALLINDVELYGVARFRKLQELLDIQPALNYQKSTNRIIGKRISGTGFYDCGILKHEQAFVECPACHTAHLEKFGEYAVCRTCKAGYELSD